MTKEDIQATLEGEKGGEQQFEMLKFLIGQQIDRAFQAVRFTAGNNFELRSNPQGVLLTYNARGDSSQAS